MSFVGDPFEHDVFISYSHGDVDGDGKSLLKQWSSGFADQLEEELKVVPGLGPLIKVFRDQHRRPDQGLDPQMPLTEQLKEDIRNSAVLTVLMGPHYLDSDWCKDERDWWFAAQPEWGLSAEGRAAVARIWEFDDSRWPAGLTDSRGEKNIGRPFFDTERQRPYEWPQPDASSKGEFRKNLLGLVGDITKHLKALKELTAERARREQERERMLAASGQVLYLHAREEFCALWENIGERLEAQGYVLLPDGPDPVPADRAESRRLSDLRIETLSGCDALLLLGTGDTRALSADMVVIGRQERHEAKDSSGRLLPCAVLDTADLAGNKARVCNTARKLGIDWIDSSKAVWSPDINAWLGGSRP